MSIEIRDANRYGQLTEGRLARFEADLGGRLPDDYRDFLLRSNGGRPTLPRFTFEVDGEEQESVLEWFFAVHDQPYSEPEDWDPDSGELPPYFAQPIGDVLADFRSEHPDSGLLPIGRDPCGNLICLGYAGPLTSRVVFHDHETALPVQLAGSFPEFLAELSALPPGDWSSWLIVES